jgi:hypothetical protein
MAIERDEVKEHLRTFLLLLESKASDKKSTAELWLTDPHKYGTTVEGANAWKSEGLGMERAANMLKERFGL